MTNKIRQGKLEKFCKRVGLPFNDLTRTVWNAAWNAAIRLQKRGDKHVITNR